MVQAERAFESDVSSWSCTARKSRNPSDEPRRESAKALILHMGDVSSFCQYARSELIFLTVEAIDASALQILFELTKSYIENGVGVHFAHLRPAHVDAFKLVGIADMVGRGSFARPHRWAYNE